jgi:parallel beta-helix repeat protein
MPFFFLIYNKFVCIKTNDKEVIMNKTNMIKTVAVLTMVTIALTLTTTASDWQQFQKNETKIGMSSASAIVSSPTTTWSATLTDFYAAPIAHGGFVYANNQGGLHKYYYNGTKPDGWSATNTAVCAGYGSPVYANGTGRIFAYGASNTIKGVNDSNSSDVWSVTTPTGYRSEITYAVNRSGTKSIYVGDYNNFLCYDVGGTGFVYRWNYTQGGEQFWAGASLISDSDGDHYYVLFGNESAWVTCLHESNGTYVDSINISNTTMFSGAPSQTNPHIRSSIGWNVTNTTYGHIFFTNCQGSSGGSGYVWKVGFNRSTGKFNTGDFNVSSAISRATTTPVIHNDRVYVGDYSSFDAGNVRCLDESDLSQKWACSVGGAVQSSPALAKRDDAVYIYVTRNSPDGGVVCVNDTGSSGVTEWTDTTVGSYSMQGVAIAESATGTTGTWIFATSQGGKKLVGHWANASAAPVTKPDLNVTAINNDTIYNNTYNIIKATIKNVGNASASNFNVTLGNGSAVVDMETVASLGAGDSTEVKFLWTPASATLYTLNVTADSGGVVDEWDEGNNSMTKNVTASTIPDTDLVVSEVNDGTLFNDTDNVVFAVIENRGANASAFNVSLKVNGTERDKVFVPTLFFRDSQLVTFNWKPNSTGNILMNITVDCDGDVTEPGSGENNNIASKTIAVVGPATRKVPEQYSTIQSAINGASNNTTILVGNATVKVFNETVTINASNSSIRLIANGSDVVICNNTGDIVTIEGTDCWVTGFAINSTWDGTTYANHPGAGINVTSGWNIIEDNYVYNSSGGIKLYGSDNLIDNNTVGDSSEGRACLNLMAISGDCNAIVNNTFDGDTGNGWILGGTFTSSGMTETDATNNTVRSNRFTVKGVGDWTCGDLVFGGDPNLIFDNRINDNDADKVKLGELNGYNVTKTNQTNIRGGAPNIMGGAYLGGNYWSSYTGVDTSPEDGIGDTAHHADQLPLMPKKYDFSKGASEDKWAFRWQITQTEFESGSSIYPSTEFTTDRYSKIKVDDGDRQTDETDANDYYAAHRFNFSMDEATADIDWINITWNGKGYHTASSGLKNGSYLYIWNGTTYEELGNTTSGEEVYLTRKITSSISNYVNVGNVTVLVKQKEKQTDKGNPTGRGVSHIDTDYVKLVVHTTT